MSEWFHGEYGPADGSDLGVGKAATSPQPPPDEAMGE